MASGNTIGPLILKTSLLLHHVDNRALRPYSLPPIQTPSPTARSISAYRSQKVDQCIAAMVLVTSEYGNPTECSTLVPQQRPRFRPFLLSPAALHSKRWSINGRTDGILPRAVRL